MADCPWCGEPMLLPVLAAQPDDEDNGEYVFELLPGWPVRFEQADMWAHLWTHEDAIRCGELPVNPGGDPDD